MRFMAFMIPGNRTSYEQGAMPDEQLVAAMMRYNEELAKAGVLLGLDGLHPTAKGARIAFTGGGQTVVEGPFTESKEIIGGYWIWQVQSKDEAVEWARRCPAQNGDVIELRQIFDPSDFGAEAAAAGEKIVEQMNTNRTRR